MSTDNEILKPIFIVKIHSLVYYGRSLNGSSLKIKYKLNKNIEEMELIRNKMVTEVVTGEPYSII